MPSVISVLDGGAFFLFL